MKKLRLPTSEQVNRELMRRESRVLAGSFREFMEAAWPIVEPGVPFCGGMHIDALCEHLQACYERKILRLLVNVPPRTGKSTIISVLFPAWVWTNNAAEKFLTGSYALQLATRDAVRTRRVIESDWYRARWPEVKLAEDQNLKTSFENTSTGTRQVVAVGSATTGLGGTFLICDDPHNVQQAESALVREGTITWFREAWATRANTPDTVRIVVQQRVHQSDVAGYCLEEEGWCHLNLPMRYEGGAVPNAIGWTDPRTRDGEILWPTRYTDEEIQALEKTLGSAATAAQLQQRPVPRGGGTFQRSWACFWYDEEQGMPDPVVVQKNDGTSIESPQRPLPRLDESATLASWDLAFKGNENNDWVVGQIWGRGRSDKERANLYLIDQERGQFDFPATLEAMRRLAARTRLPIMQTLVEEKANGAAALSTLKGEIPALIAIDPEGGKQSRAAAAAPFFEGGNVWLPHPEQFPWVKGFLDELCLFPRGKHDDQVDAATQAIKRMQEKRVDLIDGSLLDTGLRANPWS